MSMSIRFILGGSIRASPSATNPPVPPQPTTIIAGMREEFDTSNLSFHAKAILYKDILLPERYEITVYSQPELYCGAKVPQVSHYGIKTKPLLITVINAAKMSRHAADVTVDIQYCAV
jgi:hypothetical protein